MVDFFVDLFCGGGGGGLRKLTSFDSQWPWVTCYNRGPQISNKIRVGHGHLTYT